MIAVGQLAPDFSAPTQSGGTFSLAALRGRPVVLYFYPKANTAGCTLETRGFAELYPSFQRAGMELVGISVDSVATQQGFASRCGATFPLVADADKAIARQYGVLGLLGVAKRVTFFLDATGHVTDVVEGMLPGPHLKSAKAHLEKSSSGTPAPPSAP